MATEDEEIVEEDVLEGMDFTKNILEVLEKFGVSKEKRLDCYWYLVRSEYCALLLHEARTKSSIMKDVDKHCKELEKTIDTVISQAEKIKQLAADRGLTYVG